MKFEVSGSVKLGKTTRSFTKKVEASTENAAKNLAYSLLGSQNGVSREKIKIDKVTKAKAE